MSHLSIGSLALEECVGIIQRLCTGLLRTIDGVKGRRGSDVRRAVGDLRGNAAKLLRAGTLGFPLKDAFVLTRQNGATLYSLGRLRQRLILEQPFSTEAVLVVQSSIRFCLNQEVQLMLDVDFQSRQDVDAMFARMNAAFEPVEMLAADQQDAESYQLIIALHASVSRFLADTARPLPRIIPYKFAERKPSLWIAQRLYGDGSRSDEVIHENKVVHPAFCPAQGRALTR